jgi:membrane protein implicated in regulation of membrane protease activity
MRGFSTLWQRDPGLFVLGLAALTVGGLIAMLSDATLLKGVGFVLSSFPTLAAACAYLNQSRKRHH